MLHGVQREGEKNEKYKSVDHVISLKDVKLSIVPAIVQYLNDSTLQCSYDLEDDILYSVKWYRGLREFYRYTPSEHPKTKVFPFDGITVDVNSSNSTQVVLRNIEFNLSGNFSCEVTTDLPHMVIGVDEQNMMVIQLPETSPKISVGRDVLDSGDILRANCSCPPSRPPVKLLFKLNNLTVAENNPHPYTKLQERSWSDLSLDLPLDDFHFDNGRLVLHCIAVLPGILHDEVQLELESAKNPLPQRVSGLNGVKKASVQTKLPYILLCYFLFQSAIVGVV
ncbi:hypothetical protein HUJ04_002955 [Dendroctonus ponderosae]|uniref:Ig-like domain-containing protein n=1 Tax=Dendroctonus ponderosae TaxID=77166 RepID=A0AAR5PRE9_DENPD|nr:hypothetical protein HUJ04_002955 [Dendroctonus ponderosae]